MREKWLSIYCVIVFMLTGCQSDLVNTLPKVEGKQMNQEEEKQLKEKAVQYIKDKYNKEFEVKELTKGQTAGLIRVRGIVKDGKDTEATVFWKRKEELDDTYITELWTKELTPEIEGMLNKHMSVRKVEHISYNDGTEKNTKYTGDIPSIFEVLKKGGDESFILEVTSEIYEKNGQYDENIKEFLKEVKAMNFHELGMELHVYDDQLKSDSGKEENNKSLLYRYNIHIKDIQKVDIDNHDLDQYKTVIQH